MEIVEREAINYRFRILLFGNMLRFIHLWWNVNNVHVKVQNDCTCVLSFLHIQAQAGMVDTCQFWDPTAEGMCVVICTRSHMYYTKLMHVNETSLMQCICS